MKESYVYIIKCSDNSYYTGVTSDIVRRFTEHEEGINPHCYTYSRGPLELVYFRSFMDIEQAIVFEKKIKKWSQAKKLALIEGRYDDLPLLSKKKFSIGITE